MTYTETDAQRILARARATLERTTKEKLDESRTPVEPRGVGIRYSDPIEDRVEKWKREGREFEAARQAEKDRNGIVERTAVAVTHVANSVARIESDVAKTSKDLFDGMKAVNTYAEAIYSRIEELSADVQDLWKKLTSSEAKVEELRKLLDDKVVELPNKKRA